MNDQVRFSLQGLFVCFTYVAVQIATGVSIPPEAANPIALFSFTASLGAFLSFAILGRGAPRCFGIAAIFPLIMVSPHLTYDLFHHLRVSRGGPFNGEFYASNIYLRLACAQLMSAVAGASAVCALQMTAQNRNTTNDS